MFRNLKNPISRTRTVVNEDEKVTLRFDDVAPRSRYALSRRPSFGAILMLVLALNGVITLVGGIRSVHAYNQDIDKLNRFMQSSDASSDEVAIFRKGRDLIADEEWQDAARQFGEYIKKYPNGKDVDAALYWSSYALAKDEKLDEANRMIDRLLSQFPKSRWRRDAEALRLQTSAHEPAHDIDNLDGDLKPIALQSLFMSNPEQGAVKAAEILRNPNESRRLKEMAITLLGQNHTPKTQEMLIDLARNNPDPHLRKTAIFWLGQGDDERVLDLLKEFTASNDEEVSKAAVFAISQNHSARADAMIADMARNGASRRIREEAIFWLSQRENPGNDDLLIQIFDADKDPQIRKRVIFALTQRHTSAARAKILDIARSAGDKESRQDAIFWLGQHGDDQAADELISLFSSERDADIRKKIIFSLAQMNNPKSRAKLMEFARSSGDDEMRGEAIFWIGQTGGERKTDLLIQLYDSEKSREVKNKIIFALAQSNSKEGLRKLMAIAKSDSSPELRKSAIFWLGQSRDPDAMKFIEEILK
jgi:HEAT repeat protein